MKKTYADHFVKDEGLSVLLSIVKLQGACITVRQSLKSTGKNRDNENSRSMLNQIRQGTFRL